MKTLGVITVLSVFFALGAALGSAVEAGHTYSGGDCWRGGTPMNCRATWFSGDGHSVHLRIINQLNNATLWSYATAACSNWHNSPGPQYCRTSAFLNDSWVYFKRDDTLTAPAGRTWNCILGTCPNTDPMNIRWTEVYVPFGNIDTGLGTAVSAHELGHALGLNHHGAFGSNVALMTQATTRVSPTSLDYGPLPACSTVPVGSNGSGGTRCIYNGTY